MDAGQLVSIGPLQIPLKWVLVLIGIGLSTFISEGMARRRNWKKGEWTDLVVTFLFIVVISYKFGWIIFDIKAVIENPSAIIWTSSSPTIILLGIILALAFVIFKAFKKNYPIGEVLDFVWITLVTTLFIKELIIMDFGKVTSSFLGVSAEGNFIYHPINWYNAFFLAVLLGIRYWVSRKSNTNRVMELYIVLGVGLLIISLFDFAIKLYFGLSLEQWAYIALALTGSTGLITRKA